MKLIPPTSISMRLVKKQKGRGLINRAIDALPIELHLKNHQFCGPGTRFQERHNLGQRGISALDNLCYYHDRTYHTTKDEDLRYNADKQLEWKAWDIAKDKNRPFSERAAAWLTTNAMKLKTIGKRAQGSGLKKRPSRKKKKSKKGGKRKPTIKGGFLPLLLAALPYLTALGSLAGSGAAVAKTVIDAKRSQEDLNELRRHNKKMEEAGKGLYIRPYKQGKGLYIQPYKKGKGLIKRKRNNKHPKN